MISKRSCIAKLVSYRGVVQVKRARDKAESGYFRARGRETMGNV
jgi:hypothetical protein